jgi:hypothetical protein
MEELHPSNDQANESMSRHYPKKKQKQKSTKKRRRKRSIVKAG